LVGHQTGPVGRCTRQQVGGAGRLGKKLRH
jgi:hypothetical protein